MLEPPAVEPQPAPRRRTGARGKLGTALAALAALLAKLPFEAHAILCDGRELLRLET